MRGKIGVLRYFFNDVFVCLSLLFDSSDKVKGSLQTAMTLLFTLLEIELANTFRVIINMQKSRHGEHLLKKIWTLDILINLFSFTFRKN